ncbi:Uncharacterised protein [Legionella donaldsonii]|uniref:Uncharacterized protein n=1 Tax=Legionella donaldsonii TaxID=45060 RepID=A0A378KQ48_9GAMM|nr:Uncharacterised protein [Legionella donaldsonii]
MKKRILLSIYSGFILALVTQTVLADKIPSRTLPMPELLKRALSKIFHLLEEVPILGVIREPTHKTTSKVVYLLRFPSVLF